MRVKPLGKESALLLLAQSLLLLGSGLFFGVAAQDVALPESNQYITDYANVVPSNKLTEPNQVLFVFEQRTQIECRIVIVPSTNQLQPQGYAEKVFRDWRIGAQNGKGVLFLIVTSARAYQILTSEDLQAELPVTTMNAIWQQVANETVIGGYDAGVERAAALIVDELGRSRGLTYEDLAKEALNVNPERVENENPPPPAFWKFLVPAAKIAAILVGGFLTLLLGISLLKTIFFWNRDSEDHGFLRTLTTRAALFAVFGGLLYYFRDQVLKFVGVGRLVGEGVAIFGSFVFPIFALLFFIALIFILRYASHLWTSEVKSEPRILSAPLFIGLGLPLVLLVMPASQVTNVQSWKSITQPTQIRSDVPGIFGRPANSYTVDNLGRVRTLRLEQVQIRNLNELPGLETFSSLERLQFKNVPLEGVQDVSSLTSLKSLRFSDTHIRGLTGLEKLEQLEELEIDNVDIEALPHLDTLSKLKVLTLTNCRIRDLSPVRHLNALEMLYLDSSDVTDLSPLSELPTLHLLSVANTNVTDLSPLRRVPITGIYVRGTPITEQDLRETFPRTLFLVDRTLESEEGLLHMAEQFVSPAFKSFRNQVLISLCVSGLALWILPWLLRVNSYWLFILRLLFRKTVWGVVVILVLLTLATLNLPIRVLAGSGLPDPQGLLLNWATFIAVVWLILRPLLILLGETKRVSSTRWSVLAHYLVRFAPAISLFAPISYKVIVRSLPAHAYFLSMFGFFLSLLLFATPWLIVAVVVLSGVRKWSLKLDRLQNAPADSGLIVEVPLRLTNKNIRYNGYNVVHLTLGVQAENGHAIATRCVASASSVATLSRVPDRCSQAFVGSVITISRDDLANLKRWEVRQLERWVKCLYLNTVSPVWLMNDWFDTDTPKAGRNRSLDRFQEVFPYLNGSEQRFKMGVTVFPLEQAENIQQCLAANELIPPEHLESFQLKKLLSESFPPVATLLRGLFGQPHLADRLDVLARVAEVATIFFALTLLAEYENKQELFSAGDRDKITSGLKYTFKSAPEFGDWITLLGTFTNRGKTELALQLKQALDHTPLEATNLFRLLLEQAAGAPVQKRETVSKRSQAIELLRQMRNQLTAHGPVMERTSPDIYKLALITSLDLLSNLPWSSTVVCTIASGSCVVYQGLEARESQAPAGLADGVYLRLASSGTEHWIKADKYFKDVKGSIALFIGEKNFFNPLSGLRV